MKDLGICVRILIISLINNIFIGVIVLLLLYFNLQYVLPQYIFNVYTLIITLPNNKYLKKIQIIQGVELYTEKQSQEQIKHLIFCTFIEIEMSGKCKTPRRGILAVIHGDTQLLHF